MSVPEPKQRKITKWEAPPPKPLDSRQVWQQVAAELRENPAEWARLEDRKTEASAANIVHGIINGAKASFRPAGTFEARYDGRKVWARYVGDD